MKLCILGPLRLNDLTHWIYKNKNNQAILSRVSGMGGTPVVELVRALLIKNVQLDIITLDPNSRLKGDILYGKNLKIYCLPIRLRHSSLDLFRGETKLICDVLKEISPDVIHSHWPMYTLGALEYNRSITLATFHDHPLNCLLLGFRRLPVFVASHVAYHRSKHISVVAHYIKKYVAHFSSNEISVIHNILRPDLFKTPIQIYASRTIQISSIGNWSKLKNMSTLLKAFAIIKNQLNSLLIQLNVIGPGLEINGPCHKWAISNQMEQHVNFLGNMTYLQTIETIKGSVCLIHPSLEEAFPGPVAEAMALGVPVIAGKNVGEILYMTDTGNCGTLINVKSPIEMAIALKYVINNQLNQSKDLLYQLHTARKRIYQLTDSDRIIDQYHNKYYTIMNK